MAARQKVCVSLSPLPQDHPVVSYWEASADFEDVELWEVDVTGPSSGLAAGLCSQHAAPGVGPPSTGVGSSPKPSSCLRSPEENTMLMH